VKQIFIPLLLAATLVAARAQDVPKEYAAVGEFLGKKGDYKADVYKIGIPRSDLKVRVQNIPLPTSFGFSGWVAMTKGDGGNEVLMGDLPLLEGEVNPVMSALLENGFEVTAIHNHFFYMEPMLYFMHIHGHGNAMDLAQRLKPVLELIGKAKPDDTDTDEDRHTARLLASGTLDSSALDKIVGATGDKMGDVYKYTIGRSDLHLTEMGAKINARMGLNTWAAFYGSDEEAVIAGDVAMLSGEVQDVLKLMRSHNIEVVAMHHHMIGTDPQIIFMHYWGHGKAADLAAAFKSALDVLGKPMNGMGH